MAGITYFSGISDDQWPEVGQQHKWYHCQQVYVMEPGLEAPCLNYLGHPGNCTVRWQDGLWQVHYGDAFTTPRRLLLIVELGGLHDVDLIDTSPIDWEHFDEPI